MNRIVQRASTIVYGITAVWLIVASVYRVIIMVTKEQDVDVVPFISMMIGIVLIVVVLSDHTRTDDRNRSEVTYLNTARNNAKDDGAA